MSKPINAAIVGLGRWGQLQVESVDDSNAIKFTEQGEVSVHLNVEGANIKLEVKDTGIGIPAEKLPHIFDEFRQVDGSTSRKYEGTGLGLSIAKQSALLLGGDIRVKSIEGKGSTFSVSLPIIDQQ